VSEPAEPEFPLPCIVCGHKPELVFPTGFPEDDMNWQPYGATAFTSHGQYGSTVFDEMSGQYLMINVCDRCMRAKAQAAVIAHAHPRRALRVPTDYQVWAPYEPEDGE